MKIGIYGGSFNPIHNGHTFFAQKAIEKYKLDILYFVPASHSPFKKNKKNISDQHRMNMINLVLPKKSKLLDFEIKRGGVSYTFETIKYIKHIHKNSQIFLLIGADHISKLNKWKNIDYIASNVEFIISPRNNIKKKIIKEKYKYSILNNFKTDYSSTNFLNGNFSQIDKNVMKYIGENFLYVNELSINMLNVVDNRDTKNILELSLEIAKNNNVSLKKIWVATMLHKICKNWDYNRQSTLIEKYNPNLLNQFDYAMCGAIWFKYIYMGNDNQIFNAIFFHMQPNNNMDLLSKILFLSSKLARGNKFLGIQKEREILLRNIDESFTRIYQLRLKNEL